MHRRVTGPAHLRAHRFARRRVEWALTLGTTLPDHDPGRLPRRCTVASYALAVVMLAVAGVLAIARPAPDWSGAAVLVDSDSGAVFLHRDGVLHPALNLTSALLAADRPTPVDPLTVSAEDIADAPRGRMLGIVGAPAALPPRDRLFATGWSLCDASGAGGVVTSTAVVGVAAPGRTLSVEEAVLVVDAGARGVQHAFLLWAGRRLPVDLEDRPLVQALGLEGVTPRPVSPALLAALPAADPVEVAAPTGAGSPGCRRGPTNRRRTRRRRDGVAIGAGRWPVHAPAGPPGRRRVDHSGHGGSAARPHRRRTRRGRHRPARRPPGDPRAAQFVRRPARRGAAARRCVCACGLSRMAGHVHGMVCHDGSLARPGHAGRRGRRVCRPGAGGARWGCRRAPGRRQRWTRDRLPGHRSRRGPSGRRRCARTARIDGGHPRVARCAVRGARRPTAGAGLGDRERGPHLGSRDRQRWIRRCPGSRSGSRRLTTSAPEWVDRVQR